MIRFEIRTKDRIGITMDILDKVYSNNISVESMEVFSESVCMKIDITDLSIMDSLKKEILKIDGALSIKEIELLNYEKNERKLLAVIDSVDEGIISIDRDYNINIFNKYCEELFGCDRKEVLNTDIREMLGDHIPLVDLIQNKNEYNNIEFNAEINNSKVEYLTTGRAIKSDKEDIIGAVATLKDVKKAIEIAKIVTKTEDEFKEIIGNSRKIEKVKKLTAAIAKSNSTVLLRGESGTGKELFAKSIHQLSTRKNSNYVTINCAALPENLLESELFGYEKGSFTGAMQSGKDGLFKEANGGTILLDEIGEMSMFLQAKLLRVLQEGKVRKIGSSKEEAVDVRIVAATHKNLEEMIKKGTFREDLYYRLNVIPIHIPSLKQRIEDVPILVHYFIDKLNKKLNKNINGAEKDFINALMEYDWPGNVRELQNVVERSMNLCEGDILKISDLIIDVSKLEDLKETYVDANIYALKTLKEEMEEHEKRVIMSIYNKNMSYRETGKILGISHTAVMNKIKKYEI